MRDFFVTGGTLPPDAPSYIARAADDQLYEALTAGEFAYVLTSRQQGKSSLMNRVGKRLRDAGVAVAALDLSALGFDLDAGHWYRGLLKQLGRRLQISEAMDAYARDNADLAPLQLWQGALREVVPERVPGDVVLFLDEIDIVRSLPFSTDELFAAIRSCYNARSQEASYRRLTFCLLGVATPNDLIQNPRLTPFNIGRRIELADFDATETARLRSGLNGDASTAARLLRRIHHWTGGHPYLTQRLCQSVADDADARTEASVDRHCQRLFLTPDTSLRDDNLGHVEQSLLTPPDPSASPTEGEEHRAAILTLYRQVHERRSVRDDETNGLVRALKLSGAVRVENRHLLPRNRIYARVFDRRWIRERMPDAERRRQRAAYRRGVLRTSLVAGALLSLIGTLAAVAFQQRALALVLKEESRRSAYVGNLYQAFHELDDHYLVGVQERLRSTTPAPGELDLRGFEWRYLENRLSPESLRLTGHTAGVYSVAVSPDGQTIATGGFDGTLRLWNARTGEQRRCIRTEGAVTQLRFLEGGRRLAAGIGLGRVFVGVWDTGTWARVAYRSIAPNLRKVNVSGLVPTDDGALEIALTVRQGSSQLWRWHPATGTLTQEPLSARAFFGDAKTLLRLPGGGLLAAGIVDVLTDPHPMLQVRSSGTAAWSPVPLHSQTDMEGLQGLSLSPDGLRVAAGSINGTLYLWRTTPDLQPIVALRTSNMDLHDTAFSPDGRWLAAASWNGAIYTWSLPDLAPGPTLYGHLERVNTVAFLPDGRLVSASNDQTARVWDLARPVPHRRVLLPERTSDVAAALAGGGGFVALHHADRNQLVVYDTTPTVRRHHAIPFSGGRLLALSPDGSLIVTEFMVGTSQVTSTVTGRVLARFQRTSTSMAFSPNGRVLAHYDSKGGIIMRNVPGFDIRERIDGSSTYGPIVFSADSRYLLWQTYGGPTTIHIHDIARRREVMTLRTLKDNAVGAAFSDDGALLAVADWTGPIGIWNARTGALLKTLAGHRGYAIGVAFSHDGKTLATVGTDEIIKLWNVATWREIGRISPAIDVLQMVHFRFRDDALVVASRQGFAIFP